jgi:hypothetical protein
VSDPLQEHEASDEPGGKGERRRFILDDTGFNEVPVKYRKVYRKWRGAGDVLAPNEVVCPVCKVVIRSTRELRPGDRVYCMPCMSRLVVVRGESGRPSATRTRTARPRSSAPRRCSTSRSTSTACARWSVRRFPRPPDRRRARGRATVSPGLLQAAACRVPAGRGRRPPL